MEVLFLELKIKHRSFSQHVLGCFSTADVIEKKICFTIQYNAQTHKNKNPIIVAKIEDIISAKEP